MGNITIIEGADLRHFLTLLGISPDTDIYRIRIANTSSGVKVKVNEGMWTPLLGRADR